MGSCINIYNSIHIYIYICSLFFFVSQMVVVEIPSIRMLMTQHITYRTDMYVYIYIHCVYVCMIQVCALTCMCDADEWAGLVFQVQTAYVSNADKIASFPLVGI